MPAGVFWACRAVLGGKRQIFIAWAPVLERESWSSQILQGALEQALEGGTIVHGLAQQQREFDQ